MGARAKYDVGVASRPRVFSFFVWYFDDCYGFRGGEIVVIRVLRGCNGVAAAGRASVLGVFTVRPRFVFAKFFLFGGVGYRGLYAVFSEASTCNSNGSTFFSGRRAKANAS